MSLFFVNGISRFSAFILLLEAVQFSQHHLLKRLSFSIVYFCVFDIEWLIIGAWAYFGVFCAVLLICISGFFLLPVSYCFDSSSLEYSLKSGGLILPAPFFFLKIALAIQDLLCFYKKLKFSASSVKNPIMPLVIW